MTDQYTDQEIVELYRRGKRDPRIMDKLCDLTLMPEDKLLSILHLAGEALEISKTRKKTGSRPRKISDQVWREIIALRLQGVGYAEITAHTGVHRGSLNNWRLQAERLGIPVPDHRVLSGIQCIPNNRKEEKVMEPTAKEKTQVGQPVKQVNPLHVALAKTLEALTDLDSIDSFIISYTDRIFTVNYSIVLEEKS